MFGALTCVAQLAGPRPTKRRVAGSIPGQGTRLGCGLGPWLGHMLETTSWCFSLASTFLSLSLSPPPFPSLKK